MGMVFYIGRMAPFMTVSGRMTGGKARGRCIFAEAAIIPADGRTIKKKDMVSIAGLTAPVTKAASKTVKWMGWEHYIIMKVPGTSANLKMV